MNKLFKRAFQNYFSPSFQRKLESRRRAQMLDSSFRWNDGLRVLDVFCITLLFALLPTTALASTPAHLYTVTTTPVTQTLYYNGSISPIRNVPVISPTQGVVDKVSFNYGQIVDKGAPLMHVQSDKILADLRDAKASYLNALEDYNKKKNWQTSDAMLTAQDSFMRAKRSLGQSQMTYEENQHLYQLQIISKDELTQSEDAYQDAQSSYAQADRSLQSQTEQAKGDDFTIAQLRFENAKEKYDSLQQQMDQNNIIAPARGIILQPDTGTSGAESDNNKDSTGKIQVGSTLSYQQVLLNIGDMSGLKIKFSVPEININQIKTGQVASITGAGFPGITLKGTVTEVGAQADTQGGDSSVPSFPAEIEVPSMTPDQARFIRSGMNAQVAITVFQQDNLITVPVKAVSQNSQHQSIVNVYDSKTGKTLTTVITTGKVTVDSVEVKSGLTAGQKIILP